MKNKQIMIFDTTLRDGQQCPGAGMSFENNIEYARLARLDRYRQITVLVGTDVGGEVSANFAGGK